MNWIVLTQRSFHIGTESEIRRVSEVFADRVVEGPRPLTEREAKTGKARGSVQGIDRLPDESLKR